MNEADAVVRNPGSREKEIDEYLRGTIFETLPEEEDLDDIEAPDDDNFEVYFKEEAEEVVDEYIGNIK